MDDDRKEILRSLVHQWVNERNKSLLECLMAAYGDAMGKIMPDDNLLDQIAQAAQGDDPLQATTEDTDGDLGAALDALEVASSQAEVLKQLLDVLQPFVERSAIFVLRPGQAALYVSRGFDADAPKNGTTVPLSPDFDPLLQGRITSIDKPDAVYTTLLGALSRFEASGVRVIPLRLRRKPLALLLVDSGLRQVLDHPNHIRAIAHTAEVCLGHLASPKEDEKPQAQPPAPAPAPATPVATEPAEIVPQDAIPEHQPLGMDPKLRASAERSARVLVEDILLYFPQKVEMAQKKGNLYSPLKDELDRSMASFVERYGQEVENQHHIFRAAVVNALCGGDPAQLGSVPWR